jgi:hypothetical protein
MPWFKSARGLHPGFPGKGLFRLGWKLGGGLTCRELGEPQGGGNCKRSFCKPWHSQLKRRDHVWALGDRAEVRHGVGLVYKIPVQLQGPDLSFIKLWWVNSNWRTNSECIAVSWWAEVWLSWPEVICTPLERILDTHLTPVLAGVLGSTA